MPGGVDDRGPCVGGPAEAALVDAGSHDSVEGDDRLLDALTDECGVGVGVAYPGLVDDDDVGRRGVVPNALAETGQDVLGISGFDRLGHAGGLAEGDGDAPGLLDGLVVVRLARQGGVESESDEHCHGDDPEHGDKDPSGQCPAHSRHTTPAPLTS